MIPKEVRDEWADALESGEYKQTQGVLCRVAPDTGALSYCCLGVACEVAIRLGLSLIKETTPILEERTIVSYDGAGVYIPDKVAEFFGLSHKMVVVLDGLQRSFPALNDADCLTFKQIAWVIRSQPDTWDGTAATANQNLKLSQYKG